MAGNVENRDQNRNGTAALLLHGMSLNSTTFPELPFPTISPDLSKIELGEDGTTEELRRNRFDCYVRLVEKELEKSECWSGAHRIVVAHSFGGMLALHWLTAHKDSKLANIDGLVIIGSTPGPMYDRVRIRIPSPWDQNWRVGVSWLIPYWNHPVVTRGVKRLMCGGRLDAQPIDFQKLNIKSEADLGRAGWQNVDWRALRAYRFTMQGFDVRGPLGGISVPTIVLHGTEDSLFAVDDAKLIAETIPNAELRLLKGADHALPITHASEVLRAVADLSGS